VMASLIRHLHGFASEVKLTEAEWFQAIGFLTEVRAVHSMEALRKLSRPKTRVRRDGQAEEIPTAEVVPGEIVTVEPRKYWRFSNHPYLSGEILSTRLDVAALGLVPLRLRDMGMWDPDKEYWGEEGEPVEEWAKPIIVRGPRREYEMEQVIPGEDPDDPFSDPIIATSFSTGSPRRPSAITR